MDEVRLDKQLESWLRQKGWKGNPFKSSNADQESAEMLDSWLVRWGPESEWSTLYDLETNLMFFAPNGSGKTALAKFFANYRQESGEALVVSFDETRLAELLQMAKNQKALPPSSFYRQHLLEATLQALEKQHPSLYTPYKYKIDNGALGFLEELSFEIYQAKGLSLCFFLDVGRNSVTTYDEALFLVRLLLANSALLHQPHLVFKVFLAKGLEKVLREINEARFDLFRVFNNWVWTEEGLLRALTSRLQAFQLEPDSGLSLFNEDKVQESELYLRLVRQVRGSPRNLIYMGRFLLEGYQQEGFPGRVSDKTIDQALHRFNQVDRKEYIIPYQSGQNIPDYTKLERDRKFIQLLLECPCIKSSEVREQVKSSLPENIRNRIKFSRGGAFSEMVDIVKCCIDVSGDIKEFMEIVRFFDKDTKALPKLEEYLKELGFRV